MFIFYTAAKIKNIGTKMDKPELVFIPTPAVGHIVAAVEVSKLLLTRSHRLSITILVCNHCFVSPKIHTYVESQRASSSTISNRLRFIDMPKDENETFSFSSSIERQKPHVKEAVSKIIASESSVNSHQLVGFVVDMVCTTMIDVANEFGVSTYLFFPSSAAFLGFVLYLQKIHDEENFDPNEFKDSDVELPIPTLLNPFPARVMPYAMLSKELHLFLLDNTRRFKEVKGIIINTFLELEPYAVESLKTPPVYPVGPLLDVGSTDGRNSHREIMQWLDDQPPSSVVFLCFGSLGSFCEEQVKEIAYALERTGLRFLWCLRRPPSHKLEFPSDYEDPTEILPEGFLDRTAEIGKVMGWAPQAAVLAHAAVGGFVSHCGWNSTLESIWFGVPIATWPLYAEQQFNAFEMVKELELAVEIKMDYRNESGEIVTSDEIERGIRCLMEHDSDTRKKVKEMSEKSRRALMDGGSSYSSLDNLINDMMENLA